VTRPRIGISAYWRGASWGPWTEMPACMVPQGYVEGVIAAGGLPLLIPPDPAYADDGAAEILDVLDGLILVGGEDIGSTNYGHEPHATNPRLYKVTVSAFNRLKMSTPTSVRVVPKRRSFAMRRSTLFCRAPQSVAGAIRFTVLNAPVRLRPICAATVA